jgi:hypothetical protein
MNDNFTLPTAKRQQLEKSVADLRAEIQELEANFQTWIHMHKDGTNKYRPIAKRIVLSAQKLEQLVKENTY